MRHNFIYILLFTSVVVKAQSDAPPLNSNTYAIVERLSVRTGSQTTIHEAIKPISRTDIAAFAEHLNATGVNLKPRELKGLTYLLHDNSTWLKDSTIAAPPRERKGLLNWFYTSPGSFFELRKNHFNIRINPLINVEMGRENDDSELLFGNRRGLEMSGSIDQKVWFYTNFLEQQARFPQYVNQRIAQYYSIPNAGNYKTYSSQIFDITNGVDYNTAQALIGFKATKHIGIQFGHGTRFIGNGYRSLLLSDAGNNAFFLQFNTRVWRLHYQNLFMELSPYSTYNNPNTGTNYLLPKKYVAIHYLDFRITPRLSIGFFEGTALNRSRQFEFQYLNPVILYRSVEGMIGSPDNVVIGFNGRWDLFNHVRLYGQFLVDEFNLREIYKPEQKGWWGNKYGIQAGLQYFNVFGISNLDLRIEYNKVRPYTYQHYDSLNNWTHYNQPLAHPLGANFQEWMGIIRYQPHSRITLTARMLQYSSGDDGAGENWGANLLYSYVTRESDYGNKTGQGIASKVNILGFQASWMIFHNCFLDLHVFSRQKNSEKLELTKQTQTFTAGFRMNIWPQNLDF